MWKSGFFNSINGDRKYDAEEMSEIFQGLISDGVYESVGNKLAVRPQDGMTIKIDTGRGWFDKRWVENSSEYLMTLESADVTLNRYCAVVIRTDRTERVRASAPVLKYGAYATSPKKPEMTRTEEVKEYCLAYIYIKAGATRITAADIEDTRGDTELCGWVTGLIEQLSTTTLFEQWTQIFSDWFAGLQDIIDTDVETKLVNALPQAVTVTLPVDGWSASDDKYLNTVTVPIMNETKSVITYVNKDTMAEYMAAGITCKEQGQNSLTFEATAKPTAEIKVDILHMGV